MADPGQETQTGEVARDASAIVNAFSPNGDNWSPAQGKGPIVEFIEVDRTPYILLGAVFLGWLLFF